MSSQTYQPIIVSGINPSLKEGDDGFYEVEIVRAQALALKLFEPGLVTELSPVGHHGVQSFAVLPNGSSNENEPQARHRAAVQKFAEWLSATRLDYVAVSWSDHDIDPGGVRITYSHWDRDKE